MPALETGAEVTVSQQPKPTSFHLRIRRIVRVPTTFSSFWYYEIEYTKGHRSVVFFRRYSQFAALYDDLLEDFKELRDFSFPPKVLFPGSSEVAQSRRPLLELFLKQIGSSSQLTESIPVRRFLSFDSEEFQSKPLKEGYMKAKETGAWVTRWFELRSGRLSMFEDEHSYRPTVDACLGRSIISFIKAGFHSVLLEIVTDCGHNFQLTSDNPKDIELWGGFIKKQAELVQLIMKQSAGLDKHQLTGSQSTIETVVSVASKVEEPESKNEPLVNQSVIGDDVSMNRAVPSFPTIAVTADIHQVHTDLYSLQVELDKRESDLAQREADFDSQKTLFKQIQEQEQMIIQQRKRALSIMIQGISCLKLSKGKWTRKYVWLSDSKTMLYWCDGQQKSKAKNSINLIQLASIQIGAATNMGKSVDASKASRGRAGSLSEDGNESSSQILTIEGIERSLVLKFDSPANRNAWGTYLGLFCPPRLSAGH